MYRVEIDALNALVAEQKRTNELLEKLIQSKQPKNPKTTAETPENETRKRRRKANGNKS